MAASFYAATERGCELCHYINGEVIRTDGTKVEFLK